MIGIMIGFLVSMGRNIMIQIFNFQKIRYKLSFIKNNIRFFGIQNTFYALFVANRISSDIASILSQLSPKYLEDVGTIGYQKYLNIDYWVLENVRRVFTLGLHDSQPKKILDISTGAGFFPYVCRYFGHYVYATDVSDNDMYNEIIDLLNIPRVILSIEKFKPLLIKHQYDMITSFMICFNSHKTPQMWLKGEWSYFFSDLLPNLNDGGAIYLSFNEEEDNEQSQNDLFNSFKKCSTIVNRNDISLNKKQIQKFVSDLC
jgi:hypothetical protein